MGLDVLAALFLDAIILMAILWFLSRESHIREEFWKLFLVASAVAIVGALLPEGMGLVAWLAVYLLILVMALRFIIGVTWAGAAITSVIFTGVKVGLGLLLTALLGGGR